MVVFIELFTLNYTFSASVKTIESPSNLTLLPLKRSQVDSLGAKCNFILVVI